MPKLLGVVRLGMLVVLAGGLTPELSGQTPPAPGQQASGQQAQRPATGFIFGQVLDAGTGQPIPGAVVTLSGGPPPVINGAPVPPGDPALLNLPAAPAAPRLLTGS
ncbi:MAG TPA: hypothetical protein VKE94_23360, partial [Gemmataceae bacterium]|nr:hypothetical protein [Gemmataceae bacterium]